MTLVDPGTSKVMVNGGPCSIYNSECNHGVHTTHILKVDLRKSNVMVYVLSIIVNVIMVFTQLTY